MSPELRTLCRVSTLLGVVLLTSGCFRYLPTRLEALPPGEAVRVAMTPEGATELATVTEVGGTSVPTVTGEVVGQENDELLLRIPIAQRREGFISSSINQTVRVPVDEILSMERRELDKLATGVVIGGSLGVVAAVVAFIIDPFGRDEPDDNTDPDDLQLRFNVLSIPIGP